jgi:hypothetical protein
MQHHHMPRLQADARQPRGPRGLDRRRTDGGQIDAQVLARLRALDEHTAPARLSQVAAGGDMREHRVGAVKAFDREAEPTGHDASLPQVKRVEPTQDLGPAGGVGVLSGHRAVPRPGCPFGEQSRRTIGKPAHGQPMFLEDRDHRAQKRVVALLQRRQQARHQGGGLGVEERRVKPRAMNGPGEEHLGHARIGQLAEERNEAFDPEAQIGRQARRRIPLDRADERLLGQMRLQLGRQVARAGDDGEAAHFGIRKDRSEAERMKSVISRTCRLSVSSASRRARSRKVPSPCASI